jgi:hypothetical protein
MVQLDGILVAVHVAWKDEEVTDLAWENEEVTDLGMIMNDASSSIHCALRKDKLRI